MPRLAAHGTPAQPKSGISRPNMWGKLPRPEFHAALVRPKFDGGDVRNCARPRFHSTALTVKLQRVRCASRARARALTNPIRDRLQIGGAKSWLPEWHRVTATHVHSAQLLQHVAAFGVSRFNHQALLATLDRRQIDFVCDPTGREAVTHLSRAAVEQRHDVAHEAARMKGRAWASVHRFDARIRTSARADCEVRSARSARFAAICRASISTRGRARRRGTPNDSEQQREP